MHTTRIAVAVFVVLALVGAVHLATNPPAAAQPSICDPSLPFPPCTPGRSVVYVPFIHYQNCDPHDDYTSPLPPCDFLGR